MNNDFQQEVSKANAAEAQRPVEAQPAPNVIEPSSIKMHSEVYNGSGGSNDAAKIESTRNTIGAENVSGAGAPGARIGNGDSSADLKTYRGIVDAWPSAGTLGSAEREARSFTGAALLPLPDETGLRCQTANAHGAECNYNPNERSDRLSKAVRTAADGTEEVSKEYQGRDDHLLSEKFFAGKNVRGFERIFDAGGGPGGLSREWYSRSPGLESFEKSFEQGKHPDGLTHHEYKKTDSNVIDSRKYVGRADSTAGETIVSNRDGSVTTIELTDGSKLTRAANLHGTISSGNAPEPPNLEVDAPGVPREPAENSREQVAPSDRKYANIELPPLQKGWGPYQALEELQRQGKIQMAPEEMKREAERIRDREFAKLGRNYFKVGETFSMYAAGEGGPPAPPRIEPGPRPGGRTDPDPRNYDESGRTKRGDSSIYRRGAGKPGPDGTIAQTYINQENLHPEMLAIRNPDSVGPGGMKLRGSPTISAAKIDAVLRQAGSPAARERIRDSVTGQEMTFGQHLYKLGVEYGIDPAITLAFFKAESGFGRKGVAARTHSLGNIRSGRGYREYGSFAEGARDWFKLIQDGKYYFRQGRDTVGKIIPKYAPNSDGNNEAAYIRGVERDVRTWSRDSAHVGGLSQPARRSEQTERPERSDKRRESPERTQRRESPERTQRRERSERTQQGERSERTQQGERSERMQRAERSERTQPRERSDRSEGALLPLSSQDRAPETFERSPVLKPDDRGRPVIEVRAGESIQRAIDSAGEGSIINVQPGVYRERLVINKDNITLRGNGRAVIDLDGQRVSGAAVNISDRSNVTIDGFEIRNIRGSNTPTGIRVDGAGRDITISNNNIHHVENAANAHGIGVFGSKGTPIRNLTISGNDVHHLKLGQSESVVVNGNVDGFKIIGNKIHDNDNIGIDIIGHEGVGRAGIDRARTGLIANNLIYNIDSEKNPSYRGDRNAAGIYVDGGSDIVIEGNVVKDSNYGIELASEHKGKNTARIQVRRNRIEGSHLAGISVGGGSQSNGGVVDSVIENNDLRNNSMRIWRQHNVGSDVVIRNNDSPL